MKVLAVKGYIMAYGLLNMYKEENTMTSELAMIHFKLACMITNFAKKKVKIKTIMKNGWDEFEALTNNEEKELSVLSIVFDLIAKNPNRNKNKLLTDMCLKLRLGTAFSKDETIRDSKRIVNSFYELDK